MARYPTPEGNLGFSNTKSGYPCNCRDVGGSSYRSGMTAVAPVEGRDYPGSLPESRVWFRSDGDCVDYLDMPLINRAWLEKLMDAAHSRGGLVVVPEPVTILETANAPTPVVRVLRVVEPQAH